MEFPTLPTWRTFLERLAVEYAAEIYDASIDPHHPGYPKRGRYLTRRWKDHRLFTPLPFFSSLDEEMLPSVLDLLCRPLQIDPKDFGLVLH